MENSPIGKLNSKDFLKSLVVVVIVAVLSFLQDLLATQGLDINLVDLKQVFSVALTAGIGYLIKNLATNSNDEFGKSEPSN